MTETGHTITRGGPDHDALCSCGWWAEGGGVALDHYVARHLGERRGPCDLECCEDVRA